MINRVLIYCYGFSQWIGGSEYLALTLIKEFQSYGDKVTLAMQSSCDLRDVCHRYGVSVDYARVEMVSLAPRSFGGRVVNRLFRCYGRLKLKKLAREFDLHISTVNPVDFGCPGHHFVYMLNFEPAFARLVFGERGSAPNEETHILKRYWYRISDYLANIFIVRTRSPRQIICDSREFVYPNSLWAKRKIEDYYSATVMPAFYPPTIFAPNKDNNSERANDIVCISRVDHLKKLKILLQLLNEPAS